MNVQKHHCSGTGIMKNRKQYPTDAADEEWSVAAPYPVLMDERAAQSARRIRCAALDGTGGCVLALAARRLCAVAGGISTDTPLVAGRLF